MNQVQLKVIGVILIFVGLVVGGIIYLNKRPADKPLTNSEEISKASPVNLKMKLQSTAFEYNGMIPAKYTCDGQNINPQLSISEVPETAVSLVLIVDDPDASSGDFVHWTVWNIQPATNVEITEGALPAGGIEGMTDFGKSGWGGPCPPSGTHHYQFNLYAIDTVLDLSESATKADILRAIDGRIVDEAVLVGLYKRG